MPLLSALKPHLPPAWLRAANRVLGRAIHFAGPYASWADASAHASGYADPAIFARVRAAALRVKAGEAAFERDGAAFANPQPAYSVLTGVLLAAARIRGPVHVLDLGGSLGSSYFQSAGVLAALPDLIWTVVEQPHFVECGRREFEDRRLRFCTTAEEAAAIRPVSAVLLSSVLQYLEDPYAVLARQQALQPAVIIVDRTPFGRGDEDVLAVQIVPRSIYPARYPAWIFARRRLFGALTDGYEAVLEFDSADGELGSGALTARYGGCILLRQAAG